MTDIYIKLDLATSLNGDVVKHVIKTMLEDGLEKKLGKYIGNGYHLRSVKVLHYGDITKIVCAGATKEWASDILRDELIEYRGEIDELEEKERKLKSEKDDLVRENESMKKLIEDFKVHTGMQSKHGNAITMRNTFEWMDKKIKEWENNG